MTTTMNTGAASLSDEQIEKGWRDTFSTDNPYCPCNLKSFSKAVRWAERHKATTPQADAAPSADDAWESYLAEQKLIIGMPGLRARSSFIAGYRAAIAAGGAQEARYEVSAGSKWTAVTQAQYEAWSGEKRIATYTVLPRVAATVGLTDEQREAIMEQAQVFASAWSLVGGPFDYGGALETAEQEKENLRALLAAASNGEPA